MWREKQKSRSTAHPAFYHSQIKPPFDSRLDCSDLLCYTSGLVSHAVVVVDFVPVIAVPLRVFLAVQLADDVEVVGDGLVGVSAFDGMKPR